LFVFKKVKKSQQTSIINVLLFKLTSAVTSTMVRVGPKQKFWIRRDRILSIRWISDFWKSAGFRRIRNPSHPYQQVPQTFSAFMTVSWCFLTVSWENSDVASRHMPSRARYLTQR